MVVVGGRNSANTTRLASSAGGSSRAPITSRRPTSSSDEWFAKARRVGVTAGASTPDEEIEATVARLQRVCGAA